MDVAYVNLWNQRVGAILWDNEAALGSFEFEPKFIDRGLDISPVVMPLDEADDYIFRFAEHVRSNTFKGLPGMLADSLPDKYGNALIDNWLSRQGRPVGSMNPVETLCFIGRRGMGALEFEPASQPGNDTATKVEVAELIDLASKILGTREDFRGTLSNDDETALLNILKVGTSAGGARAKALIAYNLVTGEVRSGQTTAPKGFSHWLIKFDGIYDSQFGATSGYGRVEMAYYNMATAAGLNMSECQLFEENDRAHFMTKRFDRISGSEKLHVQSWCGLTHRDFNNISQYSYEELFATMRRLGLPYSQAEQMFRRMVFNVLARNCDDHTKNFSFIMDKQGIWQLAPAYDVCHAFDPTSQWVSQHCLSISGRRTDITIDDMLTLAKEMSIKNALGIIREIKSVVADWDRYAADLHVKPNLIQSIKDTYPRIE